MSTIRTRFVLLLVIALLAGGIGRALAEEAPTTPPPTSADETTCDEGEICEAPAQEETETPAPEPEPTEAPEPEPAPVEPEGEDVISDDAEIPEEVVDTGGEERSASTQTATRAALAFAEASVEIVDFDYRPGSVSIKAGDTVTWAQNGEEPHTVTADDGSFDSGILDNGGAFSMRFDEPGTYAYYCTLHGGPGGEGMAGVVVVEAGAASEPPGGGGDPEEPPAAEEPEVADPEVDGTLPNTGGGPPPVWVFAIALVLSGLTLWRVSRLAARVG